MEKGAVGFMDLQHSRGMAAQFGSRPLIVGKRQGMGVPSFL